MSLTYDFATDEPAPLDLVDVNKPVDFIGFSGLSDFNARLILTSLEVALVPLPASALLLGAALTGLGVARRRRA